MVLKTFVAVIPNRGGEEETVYTSYAEVPSWRIEKKNLSRIYF